MRRHWKMIAVVAAVALAGLSVVAVAYGAGKTSTMAGRTTARGACGALMSSPQALKAMQELRVDHQKDMQAWYRQFGSAPSSAEAQAALDKLHTEHWNDMRDLLEKSGVKVPDGAVPFGGGAGAWGGGCGGTGAPGAGVQGGSYGGGTMGSGRGTMGGWSY